MAEPTGPRSNGSEARTGRRPALRITGDVFRWDWVPRAARCFGCGSGLRGEGYAGSDRDTWRSREEPDAPLLAFCEACAIRRAQGSTGSAVVDGEQRRCSVRAWDRDNPAQIEVVIHDPPPGSRRDRDRLVVRLVPVDSFHPERGV
jgi:hypothetical protein